MKKIFLLFAIILCFIFCMESFSQNHNTIKAHNDKPHKQVVYTSKDSLSGFVFGASDQIVLVLDLNTDMKEQFVFGQKNEFHRMKTDSLPYDALKSYVFITGKNEFIRTEHKGNAVKNK